MKKIMILIIVTVLICNFINADVPSFNTYEYDINDNEPILMSELNSYETNSYEYYTGRDFILPKYVPLSTWQKLYKNNVSIITGIGMHIPRFNFGDELTDFRYSFYDLDKLDEFDKKNLDHLRIIEHNYNDNEGRCNINVFASTTDNYGNQGFYSSTQNRTKNMVDIPFAYDLGYFYVPEIRNWFEEEFDIILEGVPTDIRNAFLEMVLFDSNKFSKTIEQGIGIYEENQTFLNYYYGPGSYVVDIGPTNEYERCGIYSTLFGEVFDGICFSENELIESYKKIDNWMINLLYYEGYKPSECDKKIESAIKDARYYECKQKLNNPPQMGLILGLINYFFGEDFKKCKEHIKNVESEICDEVPLTSDEVRDLIWDWYRNRHEIPKGTNLYPFNIEKMGVKCDTNDTIMYVTRPFQPTKIGKDKLDPFAELSTVKCDYTDDPGIHNISIKIFFKNNPLFSAVAGAADASEAYDFSEIEQLGNFYNTFNTSVNYGTDTFSIDFTHSIDTSKDNGCYVYFTEEQAGNVITKVTDVVNEINEEIEQISKEEQSMIDIELKVQKSEPVQIEMFGIFINSVRFVHRIFIVIYYLIGGFLIFTMFGLIIDIPFQITKTIKNLFNKKKNERVL